MNIRVIEIMEGCKLVETPSFRAAAGFPSEVLKVFDIKEIETPLAIILPALFYEMGVIQAAVEFQTYDFLFRKGLYFQGKKLTIIGTSSQNERMKKILELTLLGASMELMEEWGIEEKVRVRTRKLADHMALKIPSTDNIAQVDDMVDFYSFDENGRVQIGETVIENVGVNTFQVTEAGETVEFDINIRKPQESPLPITIPEKLPSRPTLGVVALSKCTTGFDKSGDTTGFLVSIHGMFLMADGTAYTKEHLRAYGINPGDIKAHFLSHDHEDHASILDKMVNGEPFHLLADRMRYRSWVYKTSLILDIPEEEVEEMIVLHEFKVGEKFFWYGAEFEFFQTAHSIYTLGFRITLNGRSFLYSGDTLWGKNLKEKFECGAIDQEFFDSVQSIPYMGYDKAFMDAGGGMIHPDIQELAELPEKIRKDIIPTHIDAIPSELQGKFDEKELRPGQEWVIIPEKTSWLTSDLMRVESSSVFAGISDMWKHVIVSQGDVSAVPPGHVIVREGSEGSAFYVIIGGTFDVISRGENVATLQTGDFFGEMSLMHDQACNATIVARTHARIFKIPKKIFLHMADGTRIAERMAKIHRVRPIMMSIQYLKTLPVEKFNEVAAAAEVVKFKAGDVIIRQGDIGDYFYNIVSGEAKVSFNRNGGARRQFIARLLPGQCFGEMALLIGGKRTADVIAVTDIEVFRISQDDFNRIVGSTPMLRFYLGKLAEARKSSLPLKA